MKQAQSKGKKRPPTLEGKNKYFYYVGASDCIKAHSRWKATLGLIQTTNDSQNEKTKWKNKKTTRSIANSKDGKPEENSHKEKKIEATKMEQKAYYDDYKRVLNKTSKSMSDDSNDEAEVDVPSNFKS